MLLSQETSKCQSYAWYIISVWAEIVRNAIMFMAMLLRYIVALAMLILTTHFDDTITHLAAKCTTCAIYVALVYIFVPVKGHVKSDTVKLIITH